MDVYEYGKEIASTLRDVRRFISEMWERNYDELQVGDILLVAHRGLMTWNDMIICDCGSYGSYFVLPPRDKIPPSLAGFLCIVGARGVWEGVEMHEIDGHEVGVCDGECSHIKTLRNCHTTDMRERMVLELSDGEE